MTKRELIQSLEDYPNDSEIVVKNIETDTKYSICFITWKNSSERVILNF